MEEVIEASSTEDAVCTSAVAGMATGSRERAVFVCMTAIERALALFHFFLCRRLLRIVVYQGSRVQHCCCYFVRYLNPCCYFTV